MFVRRDHGLAVLFISLIVLASADGLGGKAHAHEGHEPLPTKGAQVDVASGHVTLSAEAHKALAVKTAEVGQRTIRDTVLAYAKVSLPWRKHQYVTTPVSGRLTKIHVKPGQSAEQGDVLAEIRSAELENAQLELLEAANQLELSRRTLDRAAGLAKSLVIAGRDLREARSKHRENENRLQIAKQRLRRIRLDDEQIEDILQTKRLLDALAIRSPMKGIVIHTDLIAGRVVDPTEHLFEIMDSSSVAFQIDVLEHDLPRVKEGQPVELTVTAFPETTFRGQIATKEVYLDPETHLGRVWVNVPNEATHRPKLLPGMYGRATIVVNAADDTVAVLKEAVVSNGTETFVLVEEAATARAYEYRRRYVATGLRDATSVQLTAGEVFPGDQVVTVGSHELSLFFLQGVLRISPEARKNLGVQVEAVGQEEIGETLEVDGTVDLPPTHRAVASSQTLGTIERILIDRGQAVHAGDVIAEISSPQLHQTQLELLQADLQVHSLTITLDALRVLEGQAVAGKRLQEVETAYNAALLQRANAERRLENMGLSAQEVRAIVNDEQLMTVLPVRAPIDGVVVGFDKVLGQVVQAEEPLFEVHNHERVLVHAYLSERHVARVPIGTSTRVRLTGAPDFVGEGTVVRSGGTFEPQNRTLATWIELERQSDQALFQNMLCRVAFVIGKSKRTLAVPAGAVIQQGARAFVFVQDSKGQLHRRAVELGKADDRFVQITKGLKQGEMVAVQGASNLQTAFASLR